LVLIDTSGDIALSNQQTRLSNLLYAGTGYSVDTVFVNGNIILKGKQFTKLDQSSILDTCEKLLSNLDKRIERL
ncbi:MAG: amidohydrolase, partial [Treponema sp.]|nr:amidohydrolase [Treponema sp.]